MFVGGGGGGGGGGGERSVNVFCVCVELGETGRVKNYLGECSLKTTRPNGERSAILVSNPVRATHCMVLGVREALTELRQSYWKLKIRTTILQVF